MEIQKEKAQGKVLQKTWIRAEPSTGEVERRSALAASTGLSMGMKVGTVHLEMSAP